MLRMGIPEYRLPRDVLDAQIDLIRDMGVEFIHSVRIGTDITFEKLRRGLSGSVYSYRQSVKPTNIS